MLPISRARALAKEQEKQKQQQIAEERRKLQMEVVALIEEDDLDLLKEFIPSKLPIDEIVDEFLLYTLSFHEFSLCISFSLFINS